MEALKRGYASMAAIPLTEGNAVIGSLNIYSDKADGFDADEMRLLSELAADLSFGIRHQRMSRERERAEKLRAESEMRYRSFFEQSPFGVLVVDMETALPLEFNDTACRQLGYTREEFARLRVGDYEAKETSEETKRHFADILSKGGASFETKHRAKGGGIRDVLITARVITLAGKPVTFCIFQDITERKIAEETLRMSKVRLDEAQRIGKLGFLDWDLITNEIECSDETLRIYGLDTGKKNLKFEEIAKLVHPDDVALAVKSMNNAIEKGVEHHIEHRVVRPDGTVVYVDTRGEVIRDANGKPIRMLGTNLDITERKIAEEALRSANEELKAAAANTEKTNAVLLRQEKLASIGTLSAGVAHEILNPLNIIGTIAQVLLMDEWPAKVKEHLDEIMAQIRRATKITNNLRMFAHVHKREITAVDAHALFDKTASLLEHDLNLDNITVDRDYDQNLPLIFVDHDLLAQVLLNLLNNARHALQEVKGGGKKSISIKTRAFAGTVEIRLSNNGPRIPEDIIGKIFDPFFTTKDPNKGTGLGLSMAHTFIRDFGGSITVQNEAPEGVTFIITLPAKGDENENTGR